MTSFAVTEQQLDAFVRHYPRFARSEAGIVRLIRAVDKLLADNANYHLRDYGLSLSEYNAMSMLGASPDGMSVSELANLTGEKPSNTTRLTDQLVRKQLLLRTVSAADRRVWLVKLSPLGKELLNELLPGLCTDLEDVFAPLDSQQRQTLEQLLKVLYSQVEGRVRG